MLSGGWSRIAELVGAVTVGGPCVGARGSDEGTSEVGRSARGKSGCATREARAIAAAGDVYSGQGGGAGVGFSHHDGHRRTHCHVGACLLYTSPSPRDS